MNIKYAAIIFGSFIIVTGLFIYLTVINQFEYFIIQLKWFLRITIPIFIIFLFYNSKKDEN